ncbi:MAG: hypothetical protein V8T31_11315 [Lachnospiraceae bacterium]
MPVRFTAPLLRLGGVVSVISTLVFISVIIMIKKRENIEKEMIDFKCGTFYR